jgi:deoxycytidylate deaminase
MCAKAIVNANISEVIYETEYRDTSGIKLLQSANIKVRKFIR